MRAAPGSVSLAELLSACSIVVSYCVVLRAAELLLESSPQSLQPLLPSPANLPFQGAGGGCQLSYVCSRGAEWASIMRVCCGVLLLLRSRVALLAGLVQSGDSAELRRCGLIPLPYHTPSRSDAQLSCQANDSIRAICKRSRTSAVGSVFSWGVPCNPRRRESLPRPHIGVRAQPPGMGAAPRPPSGVSRFGLWR